MACADCVLRKKQRNFTCFLTFQLSLVKNKYICALYFMVAEDSMCCHAGSPFRKDKNNLKGEMDIFGQA
jgi:hypothetical protein